MNADGNARLWALVVGQAQDGEVTVGHACAALMIAAGVDGVALTVAAGRVARVPVYTSDDMAASLAELGMTLGEGPGVDAQTNGGPVLISDLTATDCPVRWPAFAPETVRLGVHAVMALPLQVGAIRLGVLHLYRRMAGGLTGGELADALALAEVACVLLLDGADRGGSQLVSDLHPEVHQATGMITVQLGVTAEVAFVRLRAFSYAQDRPLRDVAADVVARRLRFDPQSLDNDG